MPPSTTDHVRFHALHCPQAVELVNDGRDITYAEFYRDLVRLMRAFRSLGVRVGGTVAVECADLYLHWLLLLACETVGVVSASYQANMIATCGTLLDYVDLAIAEHEVPARWSAKTQRLSRSWVSAALAGTEPDAREDLAGSPIRPAEPQRIR